MGIGRLAENGDWSVLEGERLRMMSSMVGRGSQLMIQSRLVAVARGEQEYFDPSGISTAQEGAKSNALMRCCKDLGIASELWYNTTCTGTRR